MKAKRVIGFMLVAMLIAGNIPGISEIARAQETAGILEADHDSQENQGDVTVEKGELISREPGNETVTVNITAKEERDLCKSDYYSITVTANNADSDTEAELRLYIEEKDNEVDLEEALLEAKIVNSLDELEEGDGKAAETVASLLEEGEGVKDGVERLMEEGCRLLEADGSEISSLDLNEDKDDTLAILDAGGVGISDEIADMRPNETAAYQDTEGQSRLTGLEELEIEEENGRRFVSFMIPGGEVFEKELKIGWDTDSFLYDHEVLITAEVTQGTIWIETRRIQSEETGGEKGQQEEPVSDAEITAGPVEEAAEETEGGSESVPGAETENAAESIEEAAEETESVLGSALETVTESNADFPPDEDGNAAQDSDESSVSVQSDIQPEQAEQIETGVFFSQDIVTAADGSTGNLKDTDANALDYRADSDGSGTIVTRKIVDAQNCVTVTQGEKLSAMIAWTNPPIALLVADNGSLTVVKEVDTAVINAGLRGSDWFLAVLSNEQFDFDIESREGENADLKALSNQEYLFTDSSDADSEHIYTTDEAGRIGGVEQGSGEGISQKIMDGDSAQFRNLFGEGSAAIVRENAGDSVEFDTAYKMDDGDELAYDGDVGAVVTYEADDSVKDHMLTFINTPKTQELSITKLLEDSASADEEDFMIKVTFAFGTETEYKPYQVEYTKDGSKDTLTAAGGELSLKADEKVIISGIPKGTKYKIEEAGGSDGRYMLSSIRGDGISFDSAEKSATGMIGDMPADAIVVSKPRSMDIVFKATSHMQNMSLNGDEFAFELTGDSGSSEAGNSADGSIEFEAICLERDGTYYYTMRGLMKEENFMPSIQYDKSEYAIKADIKDGSLTVFCCKLKDAEGKSLIGNKGIADEDIEWTELAPQQGDGYVYMIPGGGAGQATFEQTMRTGSIEIIKKGSDGQTIEGARFTLYSDDNGRPGTEPVMGFVNDSIVKERLENIGTDSEGKLKFSGLEISDQVSSPNYYWLVETESAGGYGLLHNPIKIELPFTVDNLINQEIESIITETSETVDGITYYYDLRYTIINSELFDMPKTGGRGISGALAGGMAAMAASAVLLLYLLICKECGRKTRISPEGQKKHRV